MTDRELLQQALDALKKHDDKWLECGERVWFEEEIKAIEERLAQPESEPVAWLDPYGGLISAKAMQFAAGIDIARHTIPLYSAPPKKEWVGLTDKEMFDCLVQTDYAAVRLPLGFKLFAEFIEAKLKEKNA